jgi:enoyl-CoA hydratase/carnithine racemase
VTFETLAIRREGGVVFADISAPPMNLLGPELVRDLVALIERAEGDDTVRVLVFRSADPDYFISHVDLTRIAEYRAEAAKLTGEASIALLFRYLTASRLVSIAQIEGRVRAAGSEFVLACEMRFAARESATFAQFEPAFGLLPGGGAQHLTCLRGRGRALEVMLSTEDYDAELAERYGWINRALPDDALAAFVSSLAQRIAGFPAAGHAIVKDRVNAIALAPIEDFVATRISSARERWRLRPSGGSEGRSSTGCRRERRNWHWRPCLATCLTMTDRRYEPATKPSKPAP